MPPTPAALRAQADECDSQAEVLRGLAADLRKRADDLERLQDADRSSNVQDVTAAQKKRRGAAIAQAVAEKSGDALLVAVTASKWRSLRGWAKHLGVSPGSIIGYRKGHRPCPRRIAERAQADLKLGPETWPAGIVD